MKNINPKLLEFLANHDIELEYFEHEAIFTVEQGEELKKALPGFQTKNLFLTDKRGKYFLVCVECSRRLLINQFRKAVGAKDMTFASANDMKKILDLTPGSVSIFGLINIQDQYKQQLEVYIDHTLREAQQVGWHPNRNDATLVISHEGLGRFLSIIGYKAKIIEI